SRLPSVTTVDLGPLDASAMAEHLSALAQTRLEAGALDRMVARAEGNAFYAEALLAASCDGRALPAGLAGLLLGRVQRLPAHAPLRALLADEKRSGGVPGSAAQLAHHCLASHDTPGAFTASVRARKEAQRLAAPGDAHRHYDLALSLWDRVEEPEKLVGVHRA